MNNIAYYVLYPLIALNISLLLELAHIEIYSQAIIHLYKHIKLFQWIQV